MLKKCRIILAALFLIGITLLFLGVGHNCWGWMAKLQFLPSLLAYNEAIPTVRQADHCIACRRCERDCPQNIRIPDELRRIDRYIESLKRETIE